MPAGNVPPNPSELLVSAQMIKLLDELKDICDIIIIDGTPCELVTDSIILSRIVDSTIIVTAYKLTKKEALERVIKNIQNVGGKLAGVVINKMPISDKKYEERYYYYEEEQSKKKKRKRKTKGKNNYNRVVETTRRDRMEEANKQRIIKDMKVDKEEIEPTKKEITKLTKSNPTDKTTTKTTENDELPKAMKKNVKTENTEEISLERTNDILNQINKYLDQEKENLNK